MDREEVIRLSKLVNFGGLTEDDVSVLLTQYCIEHDKPYYETAVFITNVLRNKFFLLHCINTALSFYENKYAVCKLWSAPDNQKYKKKVILIF